MNSRETFLSFHRESAEREARLLADLERIFGTIAANRAHYDAMQEQAFEQLVQVLERRRVTEQDITEQVQAYRQQQYGDEGY